MLRMDINHKVKVLSHNFLPQSMFHVTASPLWATRLIQVSTQKMETDRYNDYNAFAWVYNKHWGSLSLSMLPTLEKILLSKLHADAKILDLCCGVGTVVR